MWLSKGRRTVALPAHLPLHCLCQYGATQPNAPLGSARLGSAGFGWRIAGSLAGLVDNGRALTFIAKRRAVRAPPPESHSTYILMV
ncbi:hypothetical protein PBY51_008761 [Eleginops maclovinus]|uniref:Uncharacterized protein n=1 Tax=Eleginops maclovinus TaxID=56733 RepID=A0AAN7WV01_ELEMC|nr:hypothetical protein PBY51_008761 [Eleginops maclovinus]